jgi:PKHD-type hydroxylase
MNLKHHYWFFKKAIPKKTCDEIIKYGLTKNKNVAVTGGTVLEKLKGAKKKKAILNLKTKRDSNVVWIEEKWLYDLIQPYVHIANKNAGWNFEWDRSEAVQFTIYKKNQYYGWHCDSWTDPYKNVHKNFDGKIRKLSVSVSLNDSSKYTGGELEFDLKNRDPGINTITECKEIKEGGSVVVFPSFLWHRVKPITKGTRYSLVMWNLGKLFK